MQFAYSTNMQNKNIKNIKSTKNLVVVLNIPIICDIINAEMLFFAIM